MTDQAAFEFRRAIMQVIEEIGVRYAVRNIERTEKAFAEYRKLTKISDHISQPANMVGEEGKHE